MKKKQLCFQNHAKSNQNISLSIKHNTPSHRNSIWKVQGLPPNQKTGHKHPLKFDINMHHQPTRKVTFSLQKNPELWHKNPVSRLTCGRFEGLEVKILISRNSPSLAWDLPQVLPLSDGGLKFLTYEHIVSAFSCVFILCWFLFL